MTPPIRWLEIAVPAHAEAVEAVSEILSRVGYNGIAVEVPLERGRGADHTVKAYIFEDADAFAKVSDTRDALGHLQAFGLGPIGELTARGRRRQGLARELEGEFVPIRIGAFVVRPTWSEPDRDAVEIVLDPGMAFGTGLHPTTQQCLEALSTLPLEGKSVLDVGTGSGIPRDRGGEARRVAGRRCRHGHARGRCRAERTRSATVSRSRWRRKRSGRARSFRGRDREHRRAGSTRIAPDLAARLASGGTLLLAGINTPPRHATREAFSHVHLEVLDRNERDDWVALALRR
jgi:ribosomal protein L11 methyltransferase